MSYPMPVSSSAASNSGSDKLPTESVSKNKSQMATQLASQRRLDYLMSFGLFATLAVHSLLITLGIIIPASMIAILCVAGFVAFAGMIRVLDGLSTGWGDEVSFGQKCLYLLQWTLSLFGTLAIFAHFLSMASPAAAMFISTHIGAEFALLLVNPWILVASLGFIAVVRLAEVLWVALDKILPEKSAAVELDDVKIPLLPENAKTDSAKNEVKTPEKTDGARSVKLTTKSYEVVLSVIATICVAAAFMPSFLITLGVVAIVPAVIAPVCLAVATAIYFSLCCVVSVPEKPVVESGDKDVADADDSKLTSQMRQPEPEKFPQESALIKLSPSSPSLSDYMAAGVTSMPSKTPPSPLQQVESFQFPKNDVGIPSASMSVPSNMNNILGLPLAKSAEGLVSSAGKRPDTAPGKGDETESFDLNDPVSPIMFGSKSPVLLNGSATDTDKHSDLNSNNTPAKASDELQQQGKSKVVLPLEGKNVASVVFPVAIKVGSRSQVRDEPSAFQPNKEEIIQGQTTFASVLGPDNGLSPLSPPKSLSTHVEIIGSREPGSEDDLCINELFLLPAAESANENAEVTMSSDQRYNTVAMLPVTAPASSGNLDSVSLISGSSEVTIGAGYSLRSPIQSPTSSTTADVPPHGTELQLGDPSFSANQLQNPLSSLSPIKNNPSTSSDDNGSSRQSEEDFLPLKVDDSLYHPEDYGHKQDSEESEERISFDNASEYEENESNEDDNINVVPLRSILKRPTTTPKDHNPHRYDAEASDEMQRKSDALDARAAELAKERVAMVQKLHELRLAMKATTIKKSEREIVALNRQTEELFRQLQSVDQENSSTPQVIDGPPADMIEDSVREDGPPADMIEDSVREDGPPADMIEDSVREDGPPADMIEDSVREDDTHSNSTIKL